MKLKIRLPAYVSESRVVCRTKSRIRFAPCGRVKAGFARNAGRVTSRMPFFVHTVEQNYTKETGLAKRIILLAAVLVLISSLTLPPVAAQEGTSGNIEGRLVNGTAGGSSVADIEVQLRTL